MFGEMKLRVMSLFKMAHNDKYKNIKKLLNKQIESGVDHKWAWRQGDKEEFVCIHIYIPKWSSEIYTAKQLLNKLNESNS